MFAVSLDWLGAQREQAPIIELHKEVWMSGTSILVYAERVGGNLGEIEKLLAGPLADFDGVHVLPFFHPYDGDDAGFDRQDCLH